MAKDNFNLHEWVGNKERRLLKEDYNSYAEGQEKKLIDLFPGEKFLLNGAVHEFVRMESEERNEVVIMNPDGSESVMSVGSDTVNREQDKVRQTGIADTGQGKGHHIDEEEGREKLQRTFDDDPNYQEDSSDPLKNLTLDDIIRGIGYDDFEDFFRDNPGAEEAVTEWILGVKNFREMLGVVDDEDIYN